MAARRLVTFEEWEAERMQDPEFRAAAEELEAEQADDALHTKLTIEDAGE